MRTITFTLVGLIAFAWFALLLVVHQRDTASRDLTAVRDSLAVERQDLIECYQSKRDTVYLLTPPVDATRSFPLTLTRGVWTHHGDTLVIR